MNNMEMAFVNGKIQGRTEGKRQGAVEEIEKALKFGKKTFNFVAINYLKRRLEELNGEVKK
jgi:hypothetical protein